MCFERKLSQRQFVRHKLHTDCSWVKLESPRFYNLGKLLWNLGEHNSLGQFLSSTPAYACSFLLTFYNPNIQIQARP